MFLGCASAGGCYLGGGRGVRARGKYRPVSEDGPRGRSMASGSTHSTERSLRIETGAARRAPAIMAAVHGTESDRRVADQPEAAEPRGG